MKIKLYKKDGSWHSSIHKGNGGVSSLIQGRISNRFWWVLGVFSLKNIIKSLTK